jgi:type VI secretion system protein ImpL
VKKILLMTGGGLLMYMAFTFLIGKLTALTGNRLWLLLIVLWLFGLIAAAVVVWFLSKNQEKPAESPAGADAPGGAGDIDLLFREAEAKLAAAKLDPIGSMPVILVIGESGSTKTSTVVHSGLEPELLAGQVYQETTIVPTGSTNLWLAGRIVIAESGGALLGDKARWGRLIKRLQPGKLRSLTGKGGQAPRAALVCVDTEKFTGAGAAEAAVTAARNLRQRLGEISSNLGINIPIYVVFTRMDRVPYFFEYVRNLSDQEAQQVVGASLPMPSGGRSVYVEQETTRLNGAFDRLFRSLCDARPEFLSRENDTAQLASTYEFPREFRKLRPVVVQYLLELCRPSQLAVGPFLRGFYFSGIRPVMVNEAAPMPRQLAGSEPAEGAIDATGILRVGGAARQQRPAATPASVGSRRVPQWVFLSNLFRSVLLEDKIAMGASSSSTKTRLLQRVLLASAAALCLIFSICFIVSYSQNRSLASDVQQAALGIGAGETTGRNLPSVDDLRRLDNLRQTLQVLTDYNRDGAPLSYRWGLYAGDSLYPPAYKLYFIRFKQLLFGQTQNGLVDFLARLPVTPGPDYEPTYNTLKAYLITTSNHDKSTRSFLAPLLLDRWSSGRNVGADRMQLAQKQFEFYSDELQVANPYSSANDTMSIMTARQYLAQFKGIERVYQAMLANAAKAGPPINFNKKFPGSAEVVLDNQDVTPPFTKPGWDFMRAAMRNPERYFSGEQWVLGDLGPVNIDRATLAQQLQSRYFSDFIGQWRAYFTAASVVKYKDLKDASQKLTVLSGNGSPLLALLCLASMNTAVDDPQVAAAFQPAQAVVPAPCTDKYILPTNQNYMNALVTLQASLQAVADQPQPGEAAAGQTLSNATTARVSARQVAQQFRNDADMNVQAVTRKLLEDPITYTENLLRSVGPAELNAKGKGFCDQMAAVWKKYPFNANATPQATVADVNGIFHKPDGALWTLYDGLQKVLTRQGSAYVPNPTGGVMLNPAFVSFFNQAAQFSDLIYEGNTPDPHFGYALKPLPTEGVAIGINLAIDGQTLNYTGGTAMPQPFTWKAAGTHEFKSTLKIAGSQSLGWLTGDGLWAVFHFFAQAERSLPADSGQILEWIIYTGKTPMTVDGKPVTVRFQVDMGAAPLILLKGYFARMACVSEVAKQ